jgi:hypothetical protein
MKLINIFLKSLLCKQARFFPKFFCEKLVFYGLDTVPMEPEPEP